MQRGQVAGSQAFRARTMVGAVLAVVGITLGALRSMFNTARQQVKDSEEKIGKFELAGKYGGQIAMSRARVRLASLNSAMDPKVSKMYLDKQLRIESAHATASQKGALGKSMDFDLLKSFGGSIAAGSVSELGIKDMLFPFLAQFSVMRGISKALHRSFMTGPIGVTGNTGGP